MLDNNVLIIGGALVGASGSILPYLMSNALGRPLGKIIFGAVGAAPDGAGGRRGRRSGPVTSVGADDVATALNFEADSVILVPGYGLAVAQAERDGGAHGNARGQGQERQVRHPPVAGRMPGHMNVLLAEAEVPHEKLLDIEDVNEDFADTDAVVIVGASDVVNPSARDGTDSPISGMPILNVDQAQRKVVFVKRSELSPGFAAGTWTTPLFYDHEKTMMMFSDAKEGGLENVVAAVKIFFFALVGPGSRGASFHSLRDRPCPHIGPVQTRSPRGRLVVVTRRLPWTFGDPGDGSGPRLRATGRLARAAGSGGRSSSGDSLADLDVRLSCPAGPAAAGALRQRRSPSRPCTLAPGRVDAATSTAWRHGASTACAIDLKRLMAVLTRAEVGLRHGVDSDRAQRVGHHRDLDAVADREAERLEQRPPRRRLTGQRLAEPGELRDVEVEKRPGDELGHPPAAVQDADLADPERPAERPLHELDLRIG